MRKKQAEKLAKPTTEEPMEQGNKLKETTYFNEIQFLISLN